jgi:hypothetical protein
LCGITQNMSRIVNYVRMVVEAGGAGKAWRSIALLEPSWAT